MPLGKKKFEKAFIRLRNLGKPKNPPIPHHQNQQGENAVESESTNLNNVAVHTVSTADWFHAIKTQDAARVETILKSGQIDVNIPDQSGWPALHLCAWNGFTDVCQTIVRNTTSNLCNINLPGPSQSTPLSLACQRGHAEIVRTLIEAGCDVNKTANLGANLDVSALHLACENGHTDIVKLLLESGVSANVAMCSGGVRGVTPLHLAVEAGHLDVMDMLIEAGCDVQSSTRPNTETSC